MPTEKIRKQARKRSAMNRRRVRQSNATLTEVFARFTLIEDRLTQLERANQVQIQRMGAMQAQIDYNAAQVRR